MPIFNNPKRKVRFKEIPFWLFACTTLLQLSVCIILKTSLYFHQIIRAGSIRTFNYYARGLPHQPVAMPGEDTIHAGPL